MGRRALCRSVITLLVTTCACALVPRTVAAQSASRTILAIGAHAGDAELTMGPLLAAERARGTRTVILDLTLGERGHPTLSAEQYGVQKRREAGEVAAALGA
ncbi:MAG: PIG-L family deacetylase, partial [Geodermatophilaceae bacterium]|nr:PIG-L family deacetylase [Geodermatophilaceae bacterium]